MSGAFILAALPCAALGLALGNASVRLVLIATAAATIAAVMASLLLQDMLPAKVVVVACSISVLMTAALVYAPRAIGPAPLIAISLNAGFWTGAILSQPEDRMGLAFALPLLALSLPAKWLVRRRWQIGLKVAASWVLATAVLAATLNTVSMPSYQLDHME